MKIIAVAKTKKGAGNLARDLINHGATILRQSPAAPQFIIAEVDTMDGFKSRHLDTYTEDGEVSLLSVEDLETPEVTASVAPGWHLDAINHHVPYSTVDRADVDVFILDTGIASHPELPNVQSLHTAPYGTISTNDGHGHGTHCAGLVKSLTYGVNKDHINLIAVKILNDNGGGTFTSVADGLLEALEHHNASGRNSVVSMSISLKSSIFNNPITQIANTCMDAGMFLVAAAGNKSASLDDYGNEDPNNPYVIDSFPAEIPDVLTVAATDSGGWLATFSNFGGTCRINAPGVSVTSTYLNNGFTSMSGTSMSTPIVSGTLAMMLTTDGDVLSDRQAMNAKMQQFLDVMTENSAKAAAHKLHTTKALDMSFYKKPSSTVGDVPEPVEPPAPPVEPPVNPPVRKSWLSRVWARIKRLFS